MLRYFSKTIIPCTLCQPVFSFRDSPSVLVSYNTVGEGVGRGKVTISGNLVHFNCLMQQSVFA